ncbi:MAG: hypothetical protein J0L84_00240 [Verrucomicrobia bacterium]|nr:hypothetical protein [Verrucomicrobiota bacterium]
MSLRVLTWVHVAISLAGILSGFVVIGGLIQGNPLEGWTRVFLWTTVLTSVTGFLFPFERFLPSHLFGVISLGVLGVVLYARYGADLAGGWRLGYVLGAIFAQYLNVFVLVVQMFQKIPVLRPLAPTQKEPPFVIAQLVVLVGFIAFGVLAAGQFRG